MKPLLKWAGGKARLAPRIATALDMREGDHYIEPFLGSGAVFLHLRAAGLARHAVLNDVNPKLIAFHQAVRDQVDDVLQELAQLPRDDGWRVRYYEVREAFNAGPWEGPAHAARLIWLNRAGFNGLYRENRQGIYNVPVGRYKQLSFPDEAHFRQVSYALSDAILSHVPFEKTLSLAQHFSGRRMIYCDPPYVPRSATSTFTAYAGTTFTWEDQLRLEVWARRATERNATVVVSNHDLPVVREQLYRESAGFEYVDTMEVTRSISQKGATRAKVGEVLVRVRRHA